MLRLFKKYHRYLGIGLSFFIFFFSLSGIILNHREVFSKFDIDRSLLPDTYAYNNWNRASVAGTERISADSVLIYGNIGVWLTNTKASEFTDFNAGFLQGIDNRRIHKLLFSCRGNLVAATQSGLYDFDFTQNRWQHIFMNSRHEQVIDLVEKGDTLCVLTRSHLYETIDLSTFKQYTLPSPENYKNKVSLFQTFRLVHSGAIFGVVGRLFVDFMGILFILLSFTGLVFFVKPFFIHKKSTSKHQGSKYRKQLRFLLRHHSRLGAFSLLFLLLIALSGVFLRPPMILAVAGKKVDVIPLTVLDSDNPWKDALRRVLYDSKKEAFVFSTSEGMYAADHLFSSPLKAYDVQPPMSIMGTKVFQQVSDSTFLHGSSLGLTLWNTKDILSWDLISKEAYEPPEREGSPIGRYMVTAYSDDFDHGEIFFDYFQGATNLNLGAHFPDMPAQIAQQAMPLWNVAQEFHTGRIYRSIFGSFYILIVPLSGFLIAFLLVTGFVRWVRYYRRL